MSRKAVRAEQGVRRAGCQHGLGDVKQMLVILKELGGTTYSDVLIGATGSHMSLLPKVREITSLGRRDQFTRS